MGASLGTTPREPRGKSTSVILRSRLMKANTDLSLGTKNISYYYMYMATTSVQYYEQTDVDAHYQMATACRRTIYLAQYVKKNASIFEKKNKKQKINSNKNDQPHCCCVTFSLDSDHVDPTKQQRSLL